MSNNFTERNRRIDLQTREIAQEAKLDTGLGFMVPPRWRASTAIVVSLILLAFVVMIASALF
ncbi:hypothetical protein C0075_03135 [Rhizobium sp. KAs_5_22]|uniref:hypothetical protein n=1 Tax=Ciceribacter selenitireducens TaxID=448181 RepID=UPI00048C90AA|nr:hypothetical protein [Ciceribacter selenitireducens]PPJ48865.1 hypothetical protein C0075_03135 [Rhizobium sp. KAs_5_22]